MNEDKLKAFGASIQKLINRQNLDRETVHTMFCEVLVGEQPDLQQGAFLAALVAKGETTEEIVGAWQAIYEKDTVQAQVDTDQPLVENSGTGMDSLKTFNVSSAAAIVAAAGGARLARHGARALTSFCGTVDILESVGLDVECDVSTVKESIQKEGIGLFNGMSPKVHPGGLGRILSQIRFGSTLNLAASLANPARPTHALRGVYTEALVPLTATVMRDIGYRRGLVVHGKADGRDGGMDEISASGPTTIHEFSESGPGPSYEFRPEDAGLKAVPFLDIATTGDLASESRRFLEVLAGQKHQGCIDFTCLNAGAILYVGGKTDSITAGVNAARDVIASGAAMEKLKRWVAVQNTDPEAGTALLETAISAALN